MTIKMKYFEAENGEIFAYDEEQVAMGLADDKVAMTAEEVELHIYPPPIPKTYEQVMDARRVAYAAPLTGSDRWFAEATRLTIMGGTTEEIDEAKAQGAARYEEIQLENPWP